MGPELRHSCAAGLNHLAHAGARFHPVYRRSIGALGPLRNRHAGETCVILGNGPSLGKLDLAGLDGIPTFCLNRGYLKWAGTGRTPTYYVAVNDLVIEQFHLQIAELPCPLFLPWRYHAMFQTLPRAVFLEMRWHREFFPDVRKGLWPGNTVTFAALQIAFHMGFARAVLVGVDHRFGAVGKPHAEIQQTGPDHDHFTQGYFGPGVRWNAPDLEQSEYAYRLARQAFERDGRLVIDATEDGALEIFPKADLKTALAVR